MLIVGAVDEFEEEINWETSFVRCYSRTDNKRMKLSVLIESARNGRIDFGIKGTRHVAVVGKPESTYEVELERVTPKIQWRKWIEHQRKD